jgi:heterodisulfide reductase subunit A
MDPRHDLPVLVAGAGPAGLRAALDLATAGCRVVLAEAGGEPGGALAHLAALIQTGESAGSGFAALMQAVADHPLVSLRPSCRLLEVAGSPGDFQAVLARGKDGHTETLQARAVILATGCAPYHPGGLDFFGYGRIPDVVTSLTLEAMQRSGAVKRPSDGAPPASLAFIQCVGSRMRYPEERPACSSVCCAVSLRQALALPATRRSIFAMDLRVHVPGAQPALAAAAAEGVAVRHARPHTLEPGPDGRGVAFRYIDEQGGECRDCVDMAVLAVGMGPSQASRDLVAACGLEADRQGFVTLDPFAPALSGRPGLFVAGSLCGPAEISQAVVQGSAAALEALAVGAPCGQARGDYPAVLVVGGGAAGLACALGLAQCGAKVILLEKAETLGGNPRKQPTVWQGSQTRPAVWAMAREVAGQPGVTVLTGSRLDGLEGGPGGWRGRIQTPAGLQEVAFGAVVLALGGGEAKVEEHLYGRDPRVMTQLEFENWRRTRPAPDDAPGSVAFIQCVGSRQGPGGYDACARVCCAQALCTAVELKKVRPEGQVAIFYRDMTAYGRFEALYTEARRLGVLFFRYDPAEPVRVERLGPDLTVTAQDRLLGREVRLRPDMVVLAAPLVPVGLDRLAGLFDLPRDRLGFFAPAHPVLAPVTLPRPGMFAAGLCLGPKPLDESVAEGRAAAMAALAFLAAAQ